MARSKKKIVGPLHEQMVQQDLARSLQKKFYAGDRKFLSFEYLTRQALARIDVHAKSFDFDLKFNMDYPLHSLKRYVFVLGLLSNMKNLEDLATQDERAALLIRLLDPDLTVYRCYLASGYSLDKKGDEVNDMEASILLKAFVESIGILDVGLLQYEMFYFRNVIKFDGFLSHIQRDFCTAFLDSLKHVETFRFMTNVEYCEIQEKVRDYNEHCESPSNPNALCFNMNNPHG